MLNKIFQPIKTVRANTRLWPWIKKALILLLIGLTILAFSPAISGNSTVSKEKITYSALAKAADQLIPNDTLGVAASVTSAQADERMLKLAAYLNAKGSPLADYAADFVAAADKYGLDWRLLPAISGVESSYAKAYKVGTYNAWGWGGGYTYLGSWGNAIETISKSLKERYADLWGAKTVDQIGRIYAADQNWSTKVKRYISEIENFR